MVLVTNPQFSVIQDACQTRDDFNQKEVDMVTNLFLVVTVCMGYTVVAN